MNTVGTDTCLNQVSKKTPKTVKNKKNDYNIFEEFPEGITEKEIAKFDSKINRIRHKKFIKSDFYKECLSYWENCKKNRLEVN